MPNAYQRKKEPEIVRQKLLNNAIRLASENKPGSLTIQSVAAAAGVTKGGLLHHFPSKENLAESVFFYLLEKLDADIDAFMAEDPDEYGRFTRAYVRTIFQKQPLEGASWNALSASMLTEPRLCALWTQWFEKRRERHNSTDNTPQLEAVRLAADGIWLQDLTHTTYLWSNRGKLFDYLIKMTTKEVDL